METVRFTAALVMFDDARHLVGVNRFIGQPQRTLMHGQLAVPLLEQTQE
jgi:hypothetical protein